MQIKCDYCGSMIDDQAQKCPSCGAPNNNLHRNTSKTPQTIEELKEYVISNNVPVDRMRFHIGEDYRGAKAFGIYKDGNGDTVVYKNKADGSRAIRYQGKDEAYGVGEIYTKMREEYLNAKEYNLNRNRTASNSRSTRQKSSSWLRYIPLALFIALALFVNFGSFKSTKNNGYYSYNNTPYYYQSGDWYEYNDGSWEPSYETPEDLETHKEDYYESSTYDRQFADSSFEDSYYYEEPSSDSSDDSSDDWSSGSDWDFDTGSDWDSDW